MATVEMPHSMSHNRSQESLLKNQESLLKSQESLLNMSQNQSHESLLDMTQTRSQESLLAPLLVNITNGDIISSNLNLASSARVNNRAAANSRHSDTTDEEVVSRRNSDCMDSKMIRSKTSSAKVANSNAVNGRKCVASMDLSHMVSPKLRKHKILSQEVNNNSGSSNNTTGSSNNTTGSSNNITGSSNISGSNNDSGTSYDKGPVSMRSEVQHFIPSRNFEFPTKSEHSSAPSQHQQQQHQQQQQQHHSVDKLHDKDRHSKQYAGQHSDPPPPDRQNNLSSNQHHSRHPRMLPDESVDNLARNSYTGSDTTLNNLSINDEPASPLTGTCFSADTSPTSTSSLSGPNKPRAAAAVSMEHFIDEDPMDLTGDPLDTISKAVEMIQRQAESLNNIAINKARNVRHREQEQSRQEHRKTTTSNQQNAHKQHVNNTTSSNHRHTNDENIFSHYQHQQHNNEDDHLHHQHISKKEHLNNMKNKKVSSRNDKPRKTSNNKTVTSIRGEPPRSPPPAIAVKRMPDACSPASPPASVEVSRPLSMNIQPSSVYQSAHQPLSASSSHPGPSLLSAPVYHQTQVSAPHTSQPPHQEPDTLDLPDWQGNDVNTVPRSGVHDTEELDKARHRYSDTAGMQQNLLVPGNRLSAFQPYRSDTAQSMTSSQSTGSMQPSQASLNSMQPSQASLNSANPSQSSGSSSQPSQTSLNSVQPSQSSNENQSTSATSSNGNLATNGKRRKSFMDTLPAIFIDNEASDCDLSDIREESVSPKPAKRLSHAKLEERLSHVKVEESSSKEASQHKTKTEATHTTSSRGSRFPLEGSPRTSLCSGQTSYSEGTTIEELIKDVSPSLTLQPLRPLTTANVSRMSHYDNMSGLLGIGRGLRAPPAESSSGTCYCVPWDSRPWQDLLSADKGEKDKISRVSGRDILSGFTCGGDIAPSSTVPHSNSPAPSDAKTNLMSELASEFEWTAHDPEPSQQSHRQSPSLSQRLSHGSAELDDSHSLHGAQTGPQYTSESPADSGATTQCLPPSGPSASDDSTSISTHEDTDISTDSFRKRLQPLTSQPDTTQPANLKGARAASFRLRDFIHELAHDEDTTFGATVQNFIQCTVEGHEHSPHVVVRNVRQFMNGIKNYLVQSGEPRLTEMIESERQTLSDDEFMNVDAIMEGALQRCVIRPLVQHLYHLFVSEYKANGKLHLLSESIKQARGMTSQQLGIPGDFPAPSSDVMELVKYFISRMQRAYSPLKKLENLLSAKSALQNNVTSQGNGKIALNDNSLASEGLVSVMMIALVECGTVSAEIEADYMWALLHPCLLAGEAGYCLSTLSSAINLLKNIPAGPCSPKRNLSLKSIPSLCEDTDSLLKICIPDEKNDLILTKTIPARPNMTTRDVCSMLAHKYKITNPQDYGLFVLVKGSEDRLSDASCPTIVQADIASNGQDCVFAFKRNLAKFIWPTNMKR